MNSIQPYLAVILCLVACTPGEFKVDEATREFIDISILNQLIEISGPNDSFQFETPSNSTTYKNFTSVGAFSQLLNNYYYSYDNFFLNEPEGHLSNSFHIMQPYWFTISLSLIQKPYQEEIFQNYQLVDIDFKIDPEAPYFSFSITDLELTEYSNVAHISIYASQVFNIEIDGQFIRYTDSREIKLGVDTIAMVPVYFYETTAY